MSKLKRMSDERLAEKIELSKRILAMLPLILKEVNEKEGQIISDLAIGTQQNLYSLKAERERVGELERVLVEVRRHDEHTAGILKVAEKDYQYQISELQRKYDALIVRAEKALRHLPERPAMAMGFLEDAVDPHKQSLAELRDIPVLEEDNDDSD